MSQFVQLSPEECQYLLDLIQSMDADTVYTQRQRSYTVPKLEKIQKEPRAARLAYQDVDYLLDLIEDDDLPEVEFQREMARATILEIQNLQTQRLEETKNIESQRALRRARRNPGPELQKHFEKTV